MKTVLLTGASGFVGRQVAKALKAQGCRVRAVVRNSSAFAAADERVETVDLFSEDRLWWGSALEGVNTVIHSAWYVEPGLYLDSTRNLDCFRAAAVMADAIAHSGVRHVIGLGTCFEYQLPNAEITSVSPVGPVTLYAAAKLATYLMLKRRCAVAGVDFAWARLFYLFGEGEHPARLFPTLHRKLAAGDPMQMSSGDKLRDFLDVEEAGAMIATLVETRQTGIVNICSGHAVTLRALAEAVADQYGRRDLLSFGEAKVHPRDPQAVVGVCNVIRP